MQKYGTSDDQVVIHDAATAKVASKSEWTEGDEKELKEELAEEPGE